MRNDEREEEAENIYNMNENSKARKDVRVKKAREIQNQDPYTQKKRKMRAARVDEEVKDEEE